MPGPILIHIGYMKTGSAWLRRLFFNRPETGFGWLGDEPRSHPIRRLAGTPPFKFDPAAFRAEFDELAASAHAQGLFPVLSLERLSGHPFTGGYDAEVIAHRLREVFPEGRILVVLREQRSMIVSTYKEFVRGGGAASLRRFLAPPRSKGMRMPVFDLRYFEYHRLLAHYRKLFGSANVLACVYEQFAVDAAAYVTGIAGFAGLVLSRDLLASLPFATRPNLSQSAATIRLTRRLNRFGVMSDLNLAPLVDSRSVKRFRRRFQTTDIVPGWSAARSEKRLRAQVAEIVGDRYLKSNQKTAALSGIDLASYGWMVEGC